MGTHGGPIRPSQYPFRKPELPHTYVEYVSASYKVSHIFGNKMYVEWKYAYVHRTARYCGSSIRLRGVGGTVQ